MSQNANFYRSQQTYLTMKELDAARRAHEEQLKYDARVLTTICVSFVTSVVVAVTVFVWLFI